MAAPSGSPARTAPPSSPEAPTAAQQQPESIADLPLAWLRRLVTSRRVQPQTLLRTCTSIRDLLLESRRLVSWADLPVPEEQFQGVLGRLCVAARRSRNIRLAFLRPGDEPWRVTEGSAAHLLQSAVGQLGGPLTGVVEVIFKVSTHELVGHVSWRAGQVVCRDPMPWCPGLVLAPQEMEVGCVAPQWLAAACPAVRNITLDECTVARGGEEHGGEDVEGDVEGDEEQQQHQQEEEQDPSAPLAFQRLQELDLRSCSLPPLASPGGARLCQQLRALTALRSLDLSREWDFTHSTLVSSSATELVYSHDDAPRITSLPVQFPAVRDLSLHFLILDDEDLDAVLSLASLRVLHVAGFDLRRSHAQQRCALETLMFNCVGVDSLSRLPWSGIQACRSGSNAMAITCSGNTEATAAVMTMLQRRAWDADSPVWLDVYKCSSSAVLEATLPLMAMMRPSAELSIAEIQNVSATVLQRLGQLVPVDTLTLRRCSLTEGAWPALLPALPHTSLVFLFDLAPPPTEPQLLALCQSATWPVRVGVAGGPLSQDDRDALCQRVVQAAGNGHVTLTWSAY